MYDIVCMYICCPATYIHVSLRHCVNVRGGGGERYINPATGILCSRRSLPVAFLPRHCRDQRTVVLI